MRRVALLVLLAVGCAAPVRYRAPTLLAGTGVLVATTGAVTFAIADRDGNQAGQRVGGGALAAGLAVIVAAGLWLSVRASCEVDRDCAESESCQVLFTTAGRYGHCLPRQ
jgi:hypothetical protein